MANDRELLSLAARAREGERVPNLLFAAVHFLLLKGINHPVVRFYRSLSGAPEEGDDPYTDFRAFCLAHEGEISKIISSRAVQTNEIRRCACLLPIFAVASQQSHGRPLFMIDLGSAAGLLLLWDRYGYSYGETLKCGDHDSPVQIECGLRGGGSPPIPNDALQVTDRLGIDFNPVDVRDLDSRLWLRALIWPKHKERAALLERAIEVAERDPTSQTIIQKTPARCGAISKRLRPWASL